jgi:hypothetical protein
MTIFRQANATGIPCCQDNSDCRYSRMIFAKTRFRRLWHPLTSNWMTIFVPSALLPASRFAVLFSSLASGGFTWLGSDHQCG